MVTLERIRCTKCGADFTQYDSDRPIMQCTRSGCGAVFLVHQGVAFVSIEKERAADIERLRKSLAEAVARSQYKLVEEFSSRILALIPEDFMADYCYRLTEKVNGDPRRYEALFRPDSGLAHTPDEALEVIELAIQHFELREEAILRAFIEQNTDGALRSKWLARFDDAVARATEQQSLYENLPRDVFICYSSTDTAVAERVYELIQADGYEPWIATRNLPPNTSNYWARITDAIENCKMILVIASRECMLHEDPRKEMQIAGRFGKARLEFKIDGYKHTPFFRNYFDGCQWVDGSRLSRKQYNQLRERISIALTGGTDALDFAPTASVSQGTPSASLTSTVDGSQDDLADQKSRRERRREQRQEKRDRRQEKQEEKIRLRKLREEEAEKARLERIDERQKKYNNRLRAIEKGVRCRTGKRLLFLLWFAFVVFSTLNLSYDLHTLSAPIPALSWIEEQFPFLESLCRTVRAWVELQWATLVPGEWLIYTTPLLMALGALAIVACMLPFSRFALRRACACMRITLLLSVPFYIRWVVRPSLPPNVIVQEVIVDAVQRFYPLAVAYILLMFFQRFLTKRCQLHERSSSPTRA